MASGGEIARDSANECATYCAGRKGGREHVPMPLAAPRDVSTGGDSVSFVPYFFSMDFFFSSKRSFRGGGGGGEAALP